MAKSKSGGTRAMIRGRVGNDVYSIGLNGAGKKQQVVRSLAEVVANPQTAAQMKGRIIMSTIMQTVAGLRPIIDHSFDNVPNGQPSISEFISRNYKLIKDDIAAHPSTEAKFELNQYQQKGALAGNYAVSSGKAELPEAIVRVRGGFKINLGAEGVTVGQLKTILGWADGDYMTGIAMGTDGDTQEQVCRYFRVAIKSSVADATVISSSTVGTLFDIEGNWTPTPEAQIDGADSAIEFGDSNLNENASGCIFTKKTDSGFEHSDCTLTGVNNASQNYDAVKGTYPNGSNTFLNGGNI